MKKFFSGLKVWFKKNLPTIEHSIITTLVPLLIKLGFNAVKTKKDEK